MRVHKEPDDKKFLFLSAQNKTSRLMKMDSAYDSLRYPGGRAPEFARKYEGCRRDEFLRLLLEEREYQVLIIKGIGELEARTNALYMLICYSCIMSLFAFGLSS